ncbi:MAG: Asp-tRNA(Asn)/Glu-tRNA(Gln) amidotransferase subunit GatC [Leptospiraceae bacterium]|nr:Asp-tRNA(Asn)/Glu-tRNA(Gln) amidotransferase subunit GatC [Leptospiraceae bacterium]MDW7975343.1 Asp-tRNA(Asn)/Glu-tRNA(Gln) amidotransferase subunit GatC [Leptospiraceae bacterium]
MTEEFKELCFLARLDPNDESLKNLEKDFLKILEYVKQIEEIDTSSITEDYTQEDTMNIFRKDIPEATLSLNAIAQNAPDWESGHFVVPGIIEQEN